MADHADIAAETIETCTAEALIRQAKKNAPETDLRFNGRDCLECGDEIPRERLDMQKIRCVICQERREKDLARSGGNFWLG